MIICEICSRDTADLVLGTTTGQEEQYVCSTV